MPTPFYHVWLAQNLLDHQQLSSQCRNSLSSYWGAFLFGSTAPDVQTVSGQDRTETHFFTIPSRVADPLPWDVMFHEFPLLASKLPGERTAFIAGYLCHLLADWRWEREIFSPNFGPASHWANFRQRLYLHNVLRAYLDQQLVPQIDPRTASILEQVIPDNWLPFVEDRYLAQWRDLLYPQLHPGATISTVEVFAARQQVEPESYYRLLASEAKMEEEVFIHLPPQKLASYRQCMLDESVTLLESFFNQ